MPGDVNLADLGSLPLTRLDTIFLTDKHCQQLAKLFPAAFVVMGHTHIPKYTPAGDATYVNLGSWAEDEDGEATPGEAPRATRTHLVIHVGEARPEARLFTWESGTGPRQFP